MSADRWSICPQCLDREKARAQAALDEAAAAYGKVPAEQYESLRRHALDMAQIDEERFRTFREDYEFYGVLYGTIKVDYSGHCSECNLGVDISDEHPFYERAESV